MACCLENLYEVEKSTSTPLASRLYSALVKAGAAARASVSMPDGYEVENSQP